MRVVGILVSIVFIVLYVLTVMYPQQYPDIYGAQNQNGHAWGQLFYT